MAAWTLEPGHTEAEFRARHMMVTWVRGLFKDVHGSMEFDLDDCMSTTFRGVMDAAKLWTGEPDRDAHLRSPDFFDVDNHPRITFDGRFTERVGDTQFKAETYLTVRGTTRPVVLDVVYLGRWKTPFWEGDENRGTLRRIGFEAKTRVNRHDFGVSWQDELPGGGVVVSKEIDITIDVEAILDEDLEATGAIAYYRDADSAERSRARRRPARPTRGRPPYGPVRRARPLAGARPPRRRACATRRRASRSARHGRRGRRRPARATTARRPSGGGAAAPIPP
ncbi:MAG: YceI family protein [Actinomycetota bacterium]|nr:YceI family protein [Actinomycetota bacterium]